MAIKIGNKEGENNINGEKAIDNVVDDENRVFFVGDESKLKGTYPS